MRKLKYFFDLLKLTVKLIAVVLGLVLFLLTLYNYSKGVQPSNMTVLTIILLYLMTNNND